MSRTVFIVGAGASAEAGAPVMVDFLDRADSLRQNKKLTTTDQASFDLVFKGIAALQAAHSKATLDIDNIESVFGAFEMARLAERLDGLTRDEVAGLNPAMRRLIVTTLEKSIKLPVEHKAVIAPRPYDEFAKLVLKVNESPLGQVSLITFNYDLSLDYMLHRRRVGVDYCFDDGPQSGLPLMKLHGSVNWGRCTKCQKIGPWLLQRFFEKRSWQNLGFDDRIESVTLDLGAQIKAYEHCRGEACEADPVIVPPTWNKAEYQEVGNVWKHAARHLSEAENIIVIGYSLPESDQFFRYLFAIGTIGAARPQRFWVVDPAAGNRVVPRFKTLLGPSFESRFRHLEVRFSESLRYMASELHLSLTED